MSLIASYGVRILLLLCCASLYFFPLSGASAQNSITSYTDKVSGTTNVPISFPDDQGVYISIGRPQGPTAETLDGICFGSGCGSGNPIMAPNVGINTETLAANNLNAQVISSWQDSDFNNFMAGSGGVQGRWDIINGIPSGALGPPAPQVDLAVQAAFSRHVFFPEEVTKSILKQVETVGQIASRGRYVVLHKSVSLPPLPNETELEAAVREKICSPAYAGTRLTNKEEVCQGWISRASDKLISDHRTALEELEEAYAKAHGGIIELVRESLENINQDTPEVIETLIQDGLRLEEEAIFIASRDGIKTTYDVTELAIGRIPESLRLNWFVLPNNDIIREELQSRDLLNNSVFVKNISNRVFRETYSKIRSAQPISRQGVLAKFLAENIIIGADRDWRKATERERSNALRRHEEAGYLLDIALGVLPVVGTGRDIYEAYTGEDLMTGAILSDADRALKIFFISSLGVGRIVPEATVKRVFDWITSVGRSFPGGESKVLSVARILKDFEGRQQEVADKLKQAADGLKGLNKKSRINNFGIGTVSAAESDLYGRIWVGADATKIFDPTRGGDGIVFISRDGLRQYRPPIFKEDLGKIQSNLESRLIPRGKWLSNAHFDIVD